MNILATALREFISDNFLFGTEADFSNDDSFLELGIIDSTGVLELIAHVESTYGLKIEDDELLPENLDSIDNLVCFINRKQTAVV
jgi:acyl carrier protein